MDPIHLPVPAHATIDPLARDLAEVDAAIALVLGGAASRVRLVGLAAPDRVIGLAVAHGQAAGVEVHLDRDPGTTLTIEPPR